MDGEADLPEILAEPLSVVDDTLFTHTTYQEVADKLPDINLITASRPAKRQNHAKDY